MAKVVLSINDSPIKNKRSVILTDLLFLINKGAKDILKNINIL